MNLTKKVESTMKFSVEKEEGNLYLKFDSLEAFERTIDAKNPAPCHDLILTIYADDMYPEDNYVIGTIILHCFNLYQFYGNKPYEIECEELTPTDFNAVISVLEIHKLVPENLEDKQYICLLKQLYINPLFRKQGFGKTLLKKIENIVSYYINISIFGIIAFPNVALENDNNENIWNVVQSEPMNQIMFKMLEEEGFLRLEGSGYFFKKC